jgi:hypothetical protein
MALRPRVKPAPPADENAIAAIINRGGGAASVVAEPAAMPVPLPVPVAVAPPPSPSPPPPSIPIPIPMAEPVAVAPVMVPAPAPPAPPPLPAVPVPASSPAVAVETDPEKKFTLRLSASLLAAIEKDAKDRPDRISVNTWLIGAALQRLERVRTGS